METQPAPPAPSRPAVLTTSVPAKIPSALTVASSPVVAAHANQVAPVANTGVPVPPTPGATAAQTAPPVVLVTPPTVIDPAQNVSADTTVSHDAPTGAPIDTEAEAALSTEILKLWRDHKDGNASVQRTRAEMKSLRLELGSKLHAMKAILVRTGRGGGWAAYLRVQKLPLATADKYVAEHAASLTSPERKLLKEELPEATVDNVRQLAKKMLPRLQRLLTSAELAFEFIDELFWSLEAAEGRETDDGLEVFRTSHDDAISVEAQAAELAEPTPVLP